MIKKHKGMSSVIHGRKFIFIVFIIFIFHDLFQILLILQEETDQPEAYKRWSLFFESICPENHCPVLIFFKWHKYMQWKWKVKILFLRYLTVLKPKFLTFPTVQEKEQSFIFLFIFSGQWQWSLSLSLLKKASL